MNRIIAAGGAAAALTLAGAFAAPFAFGPDYSNLPPAYAEVEAKLAASPVKLAAAIQSAELVAGGVAQSAAFDFEGTAPSIAVVVYARGTAQRVTVDAGTGSVKSVEDIPRLPGMAVAPDLEVVETASGLRFYDITPGGGPMPEGDDIIRANFKLYLTDGTEIQGTPEGEPVNWTIAQLEGFAGLKEGISTMHYGGERKLVIPPSLSPWGATGDPRVGVPPNAMLIFDIEMLPFFDYSAMPSAADAPGFAVTGAPTTTDSGLQYYDLEVGTGAQPKGMTSRVKVHYTGYTADGRKFDSSYDSPDGAPAAFNLNGVVAGFGEGVSTMKIGGKRKIVMSGDAGYGPGGNPRAGIPPNAALIFDVELIEIVSD